MATILTILALCALAAACDSPSEIRKDTTPPGISIVVPQNEGDSDGDGLVDFMVFWHRDAGVDVEATTIRELSAPPDKDSANLFDVWQTTATDTSLSVRERVPHILTGGAARLEIAIRDSAGNARTDTVSIDLPHAKLIRTISTGREANFMSHAVDIAICGDGLGYMPAGLNMVIFDPDSLTLIADVADPEGFEAHDNLVCDQNDGTIYVSPDFKPFDMQARAWRRFIRGTYRSNAMRSSRAQPEIIYIGEGDGGIAAFDRATRQRVENITPISSYRDDPIYGMAVMPNDRKLYFTRAAEGGVLVADPATKRILKRISVGTGHVGYADDVDLDPTARSLYVAVTDGNKRGVAVVDTNTDDVVNFIELHNAAPNALGVSPSGKRIFVTTFDLDEYTLSQNALIDANSNLVLQLFDRPRTGGRWDAQVVFHRHGTLFFVARNMDVDVYLNRE